jgi:hypothetical protein
MNKEWHEKNLFPEKATDAEKEAWRVEHKKNCNCGRKLLPYRRIARD